VIFDDLAAVKPSTFQWLLHARDRIEIDGRVLRVRRDPAAMDVHLLLPRKVRFSQTDKYDPQPEAMSGRGRYSDTWHLTAGTIKPARFVQKAAGKHHAWQGIIFRSIGKILFKNDNIRQALDDMGLKVSEDISRVCNRIRTGRLKKSFLPTIRRKARFRFPTS